LLSPLAVGVRRFTGGAVGAVACWNFADELEGNALSLPHVRYVDLYCRASCFVILEC
jgi:hypothetical protein